jgi:hypothetical protein
MQLEAIAIDPEDHDAEWLAFWSTIAVAATAALDGLSADHPRVGHALRAVHAARDAAGLHPLPPR